MCWLASGSARMRMSDNCIHSTEPTCSQEAPSNFLTIISTEEMVVFGSHNHDKCVSV
jgi:hypothetical protein